MSEQQHLDNETNSVQITETKFQATAIYTVEHDSKAEAKAIARRFFRDECGHTPTKEIAEERKPPTTDGTKRWEVVVTDQSSGSLKGSRTFEL